MGTRKFRRIADKPFDLALVVAFARSAEPVLEQIVRLQLGEHPRALPLAVTEDEGTTILVLSSRVDFRTPPKNANAPTWPSQNASVVSAG